MDKVVSINAKQVHAVTESIAKVIGKLDDRPSPNPRGIAASTYDDWDRNVEDLLRECRRALHLTGVYIGVSNYERALRDFIGQVVVTEIVGNRDDIAEDTATNDPY